MPLVDARALIGVGRTSASRPVWRIDPLWQHDVANPGPGNVPRLRFGLRSCAALSKDTVHRLSAATASQVFAETLAGGD